MKRIIFLIAVLISFGAKAQLGADSIPTTINIGHKYMLIDTFLKFSEGDVDTIWFSEILKENDLPDIDIVAPIVPNNDTTYKLIDNYRIDYLSSFKIVAYQMVKMSIPGKEVKPVEKQMFYYIRKGHQLGYTIEQIKEHPKVQAIMPYSILEIND